MAAMALFGLLLLAAGCGGQQGMARQGERPVTELRRYARRIEPLQKRKRRPRAGDWLSVHYEPGQTFDQYRASDPNRPDDKLTTLYVQPLGKLSGTHVRLIDDTAQYLSLFFGLPAKVLPRMRLENVPRYAHRVHPAWGDEQLLTDYLLNEVLMPRRPADAVALLGLTATDLWPGKGWNFVFGQAMLRQRVGVWSVYRYGDPAESLATLHQFKKRMFKVATHECGHMLGMLHCTLYECCMNGSNNLAEMDRRPMWLCPECVQKVWWACRVQPQQRFESLAQFAAEHKLIAEQEYWRQAAKLLAQ